MAAPIDLRNDFDSVSLRRLAKRTRDATQSRRLLALAEAYDGGSRTDASRIGGVGLQIIRDWVLRFVSINGTPSWFDVTCHKTSITAVSCAF